MSDGPAALVRDLLRTQDRAALATTLARTGDGWPYASLVLVAVDLNLTPLLLISDLADHTRNLARDARLALLFDGTGDLAEPLAGTRATVLGRAERTQDSRLKARYLARHPGAATYADFRDFALYAVRPEEVHLVAGFGRIHWLSWREIARPGLDLAALAAAEPGLVAALNRGDGAAIARRALGPQEGDWRVTGVDPDGYDLAAGPRRARVRFDAPAHDPDAFARALERLRATLRPEC